MVFNFFTAYFLIYFTMDGSRMESQMYNIGTISVSTSVDQYSVAFALILGLIGSSVGLWSYYYLSDERSYVRFILLLLLFLVSMVILIFSSNLFVSTIGWDGLGVTSFFLVIFYKNRKSLGSGMITALTNRVGDCFLFCCLGLWLISYSCLSLIFMIIMSITKSAQIPFSSWLPSAMAAPTPVSALVHSSTLVTAGVYIMIRYSYYETWYLTVLGMTTMLMAGFSACAESDLKKVVALSTLSQLGVMMVSLGVKEKSFCFFHLIAHASFKALLFICVGVGIHSLYGTQDSRSFGGLSSFLPSTFLLVSTLSLMGCAFTSGFYSKDAILETLESQEGCSWTILFFFIGIGLTTCYSFKLITHSYASFTHESAMSLGCEKWEVKVPMAALGFSSIITGSLISDYCNLIIITIPTSEKVIPLMCIAAGISLGRLAPLVYSPYLSSLMMLSPATTQFSLSEFGLQKDLDKGCLELISRSVSPITLTLMTHYSSYYTMGMLVISMFYFVYVQYCDKGLVVSCKYLHKP